MNREKPGGPDTGSSKFSGADLVKLVRSLPRPDEEYLAIVEELITKQPTAPEPTR